MMPIKREYPTAAKLFQKTEDGLLWENKILYAKVIEGQVLAGLVKEGYTYFTVLKDHGKILEILVAKGQLHDNAIRSNN